MGERLDPSGSPDLAATGWDELQRALLNYETGSPEQAMAWEQGAMKLPAWQQETMPSLRQLLQLAEKAWPKP